VNVCCVLIAKILFIQGKFEEARQWATKGGAKTLV
jgi:hypothetical protein